MPAYSKPAWPVWQPGKAPAGCKLYLPLTEGAGTAVRDYASGYSGSFVGSPTWQRGLYGPQIGGFSVSNYTQTAFYSGGSGYPLWLAIQYDSPASSAAIWQSPVSLGLSSTTNDGPKIVVSLNRSGSPGSLRIDLNEDAGPGVSLTASGLPLSDGSNHVIIFVSRAANRHEAYFDGRLVSTSTTARGPITLDRLNLGVNRSNNGGSSSPHVGSIQSAAFGRGSVPDPLTFAQDLLSGRFAAIRHDSNLALWAALAPAPVTPAYSPAAIMMSGF